MVIRTSDGMPISTDVDGCEDICRLKTILCDDDLT